MRFIAAVATMAMGIAMPTSGEAQSRGDAGVPDKGGWRDSGSEQSNRMAHGKLDIDAAIEKADAPACTHVNQRGACVQELPWKAGAWPRTEPRWLQK